jgi:class 3 adenylate cyclase
VTDQATILIADDLPANRKLLADVLSAKGYGVVTAESGEEPLDKVRGVKPDLVLLDAVMPGLSGYDVCRGIRADSATSVLPVVMVTALDPGEERVKGIEAGADDFLTKPLNQPELLARVKSLLRIKSLHDQLEESNRTLEQRVREQVRQLDRMARLKRCFSPQLAELILSGGAEDPLKSHRREVTVLFFDLRGFTAFAETAEPEEVMGVLREYHADLGTLINRHEGTLERFAGDSMMVFFNDPLPVDNPAERAVRLALAAQGRARELTAKWRKLGYDLDLSIAQGYATIGAIGFEGRWDYGAVGTVTNLAARLCAEAKPGQILVSRRVLTLVEGWVRAEPVGELTLPGFTKPVPAFNVVGLRAG